MQLADPYGALRQYRLEPNAGLHVSLHSSGAVNVSFGVERIRLRPHRPSGMPTGRIFSIVVNSLESLRSTNMEEINRPPGKTRVLPLPGMWQLKPVGVTLYRSTLGEIWRPPMLGDHVQIHLHAPVRGKNVQYHVVVWQNRAFQPPLGEVAFLVP